ncbi:MAG: recombinase family protein [Candidatus Fimivivens sp.]
MVYGYARVSTNGQTKGNSFEEQEELLKCNGAEIILKESYTGTKLDRPVFDELINKLKPDDTLMVTKLDRFARNSPDACHLIRSLVDRGVTVNIINMGIANNTPMGKLMVTILSGFAEFERDMTIERTQAGKAIAKTKAGFKEGRPKKYTRDQLDHAIELLKKYSYNEVEKKTKISKSTLTREVKSRKIATAGETSKGKGQCFSNAPS